ncbi:MULTISPECIES: hypothetical protein [unclassified Micromonospora]|uniref:hypothetical protein n=1 Tax=unclassified Micromonospora TaxID=2617518 RepID=UPI0003EED774|nr:MULTISPECIES: hypothetical protein [unclassified Micromonospora]EWM68860.1 hypothetical protein MCBG_05994 [Micromonospora sp. M42]MCK1804963.1 hypothetical protein [Micromonospora sp. R42106]MCK1834149.1 hypothetical protein [Micromonospora sp. R42003]MCK1845426.1 hypothetical protein [Micromonospora sp. R42004]MCM1018870.1 hypothetical protein [Micromonospora sp. XM-20-01]
MDVQEAVDNFVKALEHCDNLSLIHRAVGHGGPGRRTTETSLNRGTIVLAVATWQAFVQDIAKALRDATLTELQSVAGGPLLAGAMKQWQVDLDAAVEKFATPGPDQTCSLLGRAGFNPRPNWTWSQRGGRGSGGTTVLVEPKHVAQVIDQWLRVRHDIAHGHATLRPVKVLAAVRDPRASQKTQAAPGLRLADAEACVRFFRSVVRLTADAAAQHLRQPAPSWQKTPPSALGLPPSAL